MRRFAVIIMLVVATVHITPRSGGQGTAYAPLQVFTNGPGRISPFHAGQMLEVWGTRRMVAISDPGFAFISWEWVDVFIKTTRFTNSTGGISTNIEKTVTSKQRFYTTPELSFIVQPVFETIHS